MSVDRLLPSTRPESGQQGAWNAGANTRKQQLPQLNNQVFKSLFIIIIIIITAEDGDTLQLEKKKTQIDCLN